MRSKPLPPVPDNVTAEELRALLAPKVSGLGTLTGYRYVYFRQTVPHKDRPNSEVCRTYRVRLKNNCTANGRPAYQEFSGGWRTARDAAKFVAGLFRVRYGPYWPDIVRGKLPPTFVVTRDPDEPLNYWLTVWIDGRRVPIDNPDVRDGRFHSEKHALWFVKQWANAKWPTLGLSALGFTPLPAETRTDAETLAALPRTPERYRWYWHPMFPADEDEG